MFCSVEPHMWGVRQREVKACGEEQHFGMVDGSLVFAWPFPCPVRSGLLRLWCGGAFVHSRAFAAGERRGRSNPHNFHAMKVGHRSCLGRAQPIQIALC